ncbi:MAG: phosphate signaling complex protein PhoU [Candidatus Magnetoovum sp. WYHC-5]|nr:phosphate signaling complex protein PhoU [Candidatus Magnetoovum sp. WYHC-5]
MSVIDEELRALKESILKMASLVEVSIRDAIKALMDSNNELADKIIKNDHMINMYDVKIDEDCVRLIAKRQPVGWDLRFITTAMKIITDLERIGDYAVNISERAMEINIGLMPYLSLADIPRMKQIAQTMVKNAIDSFVKEDKSLAWDVINKDDEVDDINTLIIDGLIAQMKASSETIVTATKLINVSRNIERIADHATNIAEMVIYMIEGKMIRHMHDAG